MRNFFAQVMYLLLPVSIDVLKYELGRVIGCLQDYFIQNYHIPKKIRATEPYVKK